MTPILRPVLAALVLAGVMMEPAAGQQQDGNPGPGEILRSKFELVLTSPETVGFCEELVHSLNRPTIYDGNDLHGSLLATGNARLWQIIDPATHQPRPARTAGEDHWVMYRTEFVRADLDHDGAEEDIYRTWLDHKSQPYTELSLDRHGNSKLVTRQSLSDALQQIGQPAADSSFFLTEVVEVEAGAYLLALATIDPGAERRNRLAYVAHLAEAMKPEIDCILKTTPFKD